VTSGITTAGNSAPCLWWRDRPRRRRKAEGHRADVVSGTRFLELAPRIDRDAQDVRAVREPRHVDFLTGELVAVPIAPADGHALDPIPAEAVHPAGTGRSRWCPSRKSWSCSRAGPTHPARPPAAARTARSPRSGCAGARGGKRSRPPGGRTSRPQTGRPAGTPSAVSRPTRPRPRAAPAAPHRRSW
jgi:hypothetical protein